MCWCQLKCMVAWKCTSGPAFCAEGASYRAQGAECSSSCISGPFVDISLSPWFISVTVSHSVHVPNTNCLYGTTGLADIRGNGNSKIWMPVACAGNVSVSINETCPECQLGSQQPLARKGEYCLAAGILRGGVVLLAWKSSLRTNFFWSLYWKKKKKQTEEKMTFVPGQMGGRSGGGRTSRGFEILHSSFFPWPPSSSLYWFSRNVLLAYRISVPSI